ncbi:hypothetical protein GGI20_003581 [Coemansia sp. BCRC 34301]|nr:hypothetical protein GGI20_003581 [Coemansia sp. BCRC 34301]
MKAKVEASGSGAAASNSDKKNAATEVFDELLKYYDSKIDALRQTRDALENAQAEGSGSSSSSNSGDGSGRRRSSSSTRDANAANGRKKTKRK